MYVHSNCTSKDTLKGKIVIKKERENVLECGELFTFGCVFEFTLWVCTKIYIHVN